jgi:hypothetical protein
LVREAVLLDPTDAAKGGSGQASRETYRIASQMKEKFQPMPEPAKFETPIACGESD